MDNFDYLKNIDGEMWFVENDRDNLKVAYRIRDIISSVKSPFQQIDIIDTYDFGRCLVLDGVMQTNEMDGYIYNEMISHVPLVTHPSPKDVLIIGGGDCGAASEITKYRDLQKIDVVEIDELVVKECIKHIPSVAGNAPHDKRVNFIFDDGIEFVRNRREMYDVIIIDSSDPVGPAEDLFSEKFYIDAKNCLRPDGILVCQSESPIFYKDILQRTYGFLCNHFSIVRTYKAVVPSYPGGFWSFTIASQKYDPLNADTERLAKNTKYINEEIFKSSFNLPNFMKEMLELE
ncbi:MAG TPA: polyamine aminopropyltransferase [Clostridiaceae bacterium]|nr:polyamine aminopropyltransferase [Clostridiaceae bacterium]